MNLPIPTVGQSPGPDYASEVNSALTLVDSHNHSAGQGVQINPSGININADLPINVNNLVTARSLRFSPQGSPLSGAADLGCVYESGVDLYYNDGNGNQVRITQSGGVAGSPGSIANLTSPASASYVSADETFVWQSDASTPANLDAGSVIIRNILANSNGITISAPNALASSYALTLPSLPAQTNVMTLDSSGNIESTTWDVIGQSMTSVGADAIANTRTRTVGSTVVAGGVAISGSSGAFSTTSSTPVNVTNLSVTITTTGRPVWIGLIPDGVSSLTPSFIFVETTSGTASTSIIGLLKGGSYLNNIFFGNSDGTSTQHLQRIPPSSINYIDTAVNGSPGTYTYSIQIQVTVGTDTGIFYARLAAYEL